MRSWLPLAALGLWLGTAPLAPSAQAATATVEPEDAALQRVGYRAPAGARRVGKLFPSKSGEEVAFFERREEATSLVVAIKGGGIARWSVEPAATRLEVYWVGPSELLLGPDVLTPKMRVSWQVARR